MSLKESSEPSATTHATALVWDLPTRLFHWLLVILVAVSIATGLDGGLEAMEIHMYSGTAILALVIFRIIWGLIGGRYARFSDFIKGPGTVISYVRQLLSGGHQPTVGHNPLGGWSILASLSLLTFQAVTGLFSNDDIFTDGPLMDLIGKEESDAMTSRHLLSINLLYGLIALHVSAVIFYMLKDEDLIQPMLHGKKKAVAPKPDAKGNPIVALALLIIVGALVYYGVWVWPT